MADDSHSIPDEGGEEQKITIAEDLVVTKYKMASEITNRKHIAIFYLLVNSILLIKFFFSFRRVEGVDG